MTDILLIHPPVALPCEPPLGLCILAGALRSRGAQVRLVDANIESLHGLLAGLPETTDASLGPRSTAHHRALQGWPHALSLLQHPRGYENLDRHQGAVKRLALALRLAGARQGGRAQVGLADYQDPALSPLRLADLRAAARWPDASPYAPSFSALAERARAERPRVVGISVNYLHQALPALALAGIVRRVLPDTPLLLGGALMGCWRGRIAPGDLRPAISEIIFGDGVEALLAAVHGQAGDAPAPGNGRAAPDCPVTPPGAPDYADLPWDQYLAPGRVAPVCTSLGCVWGRCRYCPEAVTQPGAAVVDPAAIGALLDETRSATRAELLHVTDSAIPPGALTALAAQRQSARWYGFSRFWPELSDPAFCQKLRRGGCVMLQLGLESGSERVLRRLRKGIDLALASRAIRALADAGIAVYLYIMFGIPGETEADAHQTLTFVADHAPHIAFINTSLLNLPVVSPDEPDLHRVPLAQTERDLTLYHGFHCDGSWERRQARLFMERTFARHGAVAPILRRTPAVFGANHAAFFTHLTRLTSSLSDRSWPTALDERAR